MFAVRIVIFCCALASAHAMAREALNAEFQWSATAPVVEPPIRRNYPLVSIKDPSIVAVDRRWHLFATVADVRGWWGMCTLDFDDWARVGAAEATVLTDFDPLKGYHCAPQVFYFRPQKKWYLIYQSSQPQYSTTETIEDPRSWSAPTNFFDGVPASVVAKAWLDFWIIADETHVYLFFTGDNGCFYRSRTLIRDFPRAMSQPEVAMKESKADLFEGSATYRLQGRDEFLTIVEAMGPARYYRAFLADHLDGPWRPLATSWEAPFAGEENVQFGKGVSPWTRDISHGELLRATADERMLVDPKNLHFLFQGRAASSDGMDYAKLPYKLGILSLQKGPW